MWPHCGAHLAGGVRRLNQAILLRRRQAEEIAKTPLPTPALRGRAVNRAAQSAKEQIRRTIVGAVTER